MIGDINDGIYHCERSGSQMKYLPKTGAEALRTGAHPRRAAFRYIVDNSEECG
jgi:hypothetical protein